MEKDEKSQIGYEIIKKAKAFGADLAGTANIAELRKSPSHSLSGMLTGYNGVGTKKIEGRKHGEVIWPGYASSAVVIAVAHPDDSPDMDWWIDGLKGGTKGNAQLIAIFKNLSQWLETQKHITCFKLPYHIESGGVFMKDAAVLGGLGCIGKNNILVTPSYGPRIRLRVMLLSRDLSSTGIVDFDPCRDCREYCRKVCPQGAFDKKIYTSETYGQPILPGRTGMYSRHRCNMQMEADVAAGSNVPVNDTDRVGKRVKFCRRCEQVCPVGRKQQPEEASEKCK